ncbi:protein LST8-like protein [Senna tora]|uniref:Target of rapamycin complex subunit LST8 n=1 Tax=Senna tora TaxID=362788 RepID=A0A834SI77_9FABA|nr:protein LST8-like protein [Senna tora]
MPPPAIQHIELRLRAGQGTQELHCLASYFHLFFPYNLRCRVVASPRILRKFRIAAATASGLCLRLDSESFCFLIHWLNKEQFLLLSTLLKCKVLSKVRLPNVGLESTMTQPTVILATASYDHTIRFWEAKSGRCYRTIQYPDSQVNRLEITPDKRYLAAAGNPHIRLFDVNSNSTQPVMSYDSHTNNVMAVGFQCDGNWMYSGSEDGTVKIWDLRAPGCQREYESRAAVNTVVLHPNQTELISGDQNGNIRVWDLTANSCSCELTHAAITLTSHMYYDILSIICFITGHRDMFVCWLKVVKVPEVDTAVRSLTVMWDGSLVVAANNHGTCYVWRLLRGTQTMTNFEPLHKLQAHKGYILNVFFHLSSVNPQSLAMDDRGSRVAFLYLATASSDHTVKIWNVDGFTLEKTLIGHQRWVWDCVFSVDGAYLITASSDTTARLWSMSTGEDIRVYQGHHKATICCALHDGAEPTTS